MSIDKYDSNLPKIGQKRIKTQTRSKSYRSSLQLQRRFAQNIRKIAGNQYLKELQRSEFQLKKKQLLLKDNQQSKHYIGKARVKTVNKNAFISKNQTYPEIVDNQFIDHHEKKISILTPNKNQQTNQRDITEDFYNYYIQGKQLTQNDIKNFKQFLEQYNPLFHKIDPIITQSLLKVGVIKVFMPNSFIYRENFPIKQIGIILWGEVVLKYKGHKQRFNCVCGNSIGEQVIFQDLDFSTRKYSSVQKGQLWANERCKAIKNTGILFIEQKQYEYMKETLIKQRCKAKIMKLQTMLQRNYFKKRQFKSTMY